MDEHRNDHSTSEKSMKKEFIFREISRIRIDLEIARTVGSGVEGTKEGFQREGQELYSFLEEKLVLLDK